MADFLFRGGENEKARTFQCGPWWSIERVLRALIAGPREAGVIAIIVGGARGDAPIGGGVRRSGARKDHGSILHANPAAYNPRGRRSSVRRHGTAAWKLEGVLKRP
ncbi:hypothetical protein GCM10008101_11990 [Lysobacter xinjiangensis]|uniref:Uncharacterized protein n=1 Tax=Cognatilysobacter xinjiangensis TaxID=546892 RepID=A0ABQ3BZL2_9GAMM|nr:hypothetical protein GCM10008101_11990 [Lysobacter xinjiangensis]